MCVGEHERRTGFCVYVCVGDGLGGRVASHGCECIYFVNVHACVE